MEAWLRQGREGKEQGREVEWGVQCAQGRILSRTRRQRSREGEQSRRGGAVREKESGHMEMRMGPPAIAEKNWWNFVFPERL